MKVDIPKPIIYMTAGAIIDRIITNIFGTSLSDILDNALSYFNEKQRLKEIEARRVVDVMGDVVGYLSDSGDIIKGDLNDY